MAVSDGDEVVPGINKMVDAFERRGLPIFYTRDWHPANHISFKSQGGIWPPHCVQGTAGAEFQPSLRVPIGAVVINKGDDPAAEAYSGFQGTDMADRLKRLGVREVFIGGLATDYCVRQSALDARREGFEVNVVEDCVRAVNLRPNDGAEALSAMLEAGAKMTNSSAVVGLLVSTQQ